MGDHRALVLPTEMRSNPFGNKHRTVSPPGTAKSDGEVAAVYRLKFFDPAIKESDDISQERLHQLLIVQIRHDVGVSPV